MEDIKKLLKEELDKDEPNLKLIAKLTEELVDAGEPDVRFSVDAQHINRLGLELVGKQETALSELIKNAYDADATEVTVSFTNHLKQSGGKLVISDNGSGMTAEDLKQSWMKISTPVKINEPISPKYRRGRAGRKGIGRFAVQRLGKSLVLETKVAGQPRGTRVAFNWDKDFVSGGSLSHIWSRVESFAKAPQDHGTCLTIDPLRDAWPNAALSRVWKTIVLLQSPHKIASLRGAEHGDPGFHVEINGASIRGESKKYSIDENFLAKATAKIEGRIDADGKAKYSVKSAILDLDDEFEVDDPLYLLTGPVHLTADYFIYDREVLSGLSFREATDIGQKFGGIRIYRNGFRVLPYGESTDDWLQLARDVGRRFLLVPANNNNFFGNIELDPEENPLLEETSSREGFIENEAFEELQRFSRSCLEWAAKRVASVRERKTTASQPDFVSKLRRPSEIFEEFQANLIRHDENEWKQKDKPEAYIEMLRRRAERARDEFRRYEQAADNEKKLHLQYEEMLRVLASLGLSISVFSHEVRSRNDAISKSVALLETYGSHLTGELHEAFKRDMSDLSTAAQSVFDLGGYLADLVGRTVRRELEEVSLRGAIETFHHNFSSYLDRSDIEFTHSVQPPGLKTCKMHRSELDSVLFNFLSNSKKAINRNKPGAPSILIDVHERDGNVVIRFEDNGTGIDPAISDRVFDAFFTSTLSEDDEVAGPGMGLGLRIVSDIASAYGGSVEVTDPTEGYSTCLEFCIPTNESGESDV